MKSVGSLPLRSTILPWWRSQQSNTYVGHQVMSPLYCCYSFCLPLNCFVVEIDFCAINLRVVTKKNAGSMFLKGSTDLFVFRASPQKDIIIVWKQETVGCLAPRISFSPGLDLHCMCLENSKTINPFFFSWIGFALHVSREFQNNQSCLLLLDWISIAYLENSKTINPFFSWIEYCIFLEIQGERKKETHAPTNPRKKYDLP